MNIYWFVICCSISQGIITISVELRFNKSELFLNYQTPRNPKHQTMVLTTINILDFDLLMIIVCAAYNYTVHCIENAFVQIISNTKTNRLQAYAAPFSSIYTKDIANIYPIRAEFKVELLENAKYHVTMKHSLSHSLSLSPQMWWENPHSGCYSIDIKANGQC